MEALKDFDKARETAAKEKSAKAEADKNVRETAAAARRAEEKAKTAKDIPTKQAADKAAQEAKTKAAEAQTKAAEAATRSQKAVADVAAAKASVLEAAAKRGMASTQQKAGNPKDPEPQQTTKQYTDATPQQRAEVDRKVREQQQLKDQLKELAKEKLTPEQLKEKLDQLGKEHQPPPK
jgi:hypothetical protein